MDLLWKSKQRSQQQHSRLQSAVSELATNSYTDEHATIGDNFVAWINKSKVEQKKPAQLSELVEYCKNRYCFTPLAKGKRVAVSRRTLSPIVEYQVPYAEQIGQKHSIYETKTSWRRKNLRRGGYTPEHKPYREIGSRYDKSTELEGKNILINQLADGFTLKDLEIVRNIGPRKVSINNIGNDEAVDELLRCVKERSKACGSKIPKSQKNLFNMRKTNSAVQEATRKMYEMLHETEHRLLSIQAGSRYIDHLAACKKRRRVYNMLKNPHLYSKHYHRMVIQPASTGSGTRLSAIKLRKATSEAAGAKSLSLTLKDIAKSKDFTSSIARSKLKHMYFNKLNCIHIILCTMLNMKQLKLTNSPLPWNVMRKLRVLPQNSKLGRNKQHRKKSKLTTASHSTAVKFRSPLIQLTKYDVLPDITRKTEGSVNSRTSNKDSSVNSHNSETEFRLTVNSSGKHESRQGSRLSASLPTNRSYKSRASVRNLHTNQPTSTPGSKRLRPFHTYSTTKTGVDGSIVDPALVTWEEFLKWGNPREISKDKKMRFAVGTKSLQKSSSTGLSQLNVTEEYGKRALGYSNSTEAIKKSVSHMWQLMRGSFIQRLRQSVVEIKKSESTTGTLGETNKLMKKLGLDSGNPVSHLKLNWMKITLRGNKMMIREINKRQRDSVLRYQTVIHSKEILDTTKWKHKWSQHFQTKMRAIEEEKTDQYAECIETLYEEARELQLLNNPLVNQLLEKIKLVHSIDSIKYMTIFRGQIKIQAIIKSLPAFEICTLEMQVALQFVLVEILQGDTEMLIPMFKSRGLPLHPGVLEQTKNSNLDEMMKPPKLSVNDYIGTNRVLSSSPPARPGMSRSLIDKLQKYVIYGSQ